MPAPEAPRAGTAVRRPFRGVTVVAAFAVGLTVVLTGYARHLHRTLARMRNDQASESATILALEGVHAFVQTADAEALMTWPAGADSMVMTARVFGAGRSMGTYAVSLTRVEAESFRLLATGRLVSGEQSMMCSVHGSVRLAGEPGRKITVGYGAAPLCNGTRHRSALTTQLGS